MALVSDGRTQSALAKAFGVTVAVVRAGERVGRNLLGQLEGDDDLHVVPVFPGEREHECSQECWCDPRRLDDEPRIVVHERRAEA